MSKQTESEMKVRYAIGKSGFGREGDVGYLETWPDMQASVEAEVDDGFFLNKAKGSGTHTFRDDYSRSNLKTLNQFVFKFRTVYKREDI